MRLAAGRQLPDWLSCDSGRHTRELTKVRAGYCFNPPCGSQTSSRWKGKLSVLKTRRLPIGPVTALVGRGLSFCPPFSARPTFCQWLGNKNGRPILTKHGWDCRKNRVGTTPLIPAPLALWLSPN